MFKKEKDEDTAPGARGDAQAENISSPPLKPFSKRGSHQPGKLPPAAASLHAEIPHLQAGVPIPARRLDRSRPGDAESKRLVVGRDISLKGEIKSCDKLVVEGCVEATLTSARIIEVTPTGFFKGKAQVREAVISGRFEGELTADDILTVRNGGKISGTIRYGRIVIESGGEIAGEMETLSVPPQENEEGIGAFADIKPKIPPRPPKKRT